MASPGQIRTLNKGFIVEIRTDWKEADSAGFCDSCGYPYDKGDKMYHVADLGRAFCCQDCASQWAIKHLCGCGSGLCHEELYDARGIYCCRMCPKCEGLRRSQYRAQVLTDSNYEADEAIEPG